MELSISRAIFNISHHKPYSPSSYRSQSRKSLPLKGASISRGSRAFLYSGNHLVRSTTSEDTSTSINAQSEEVNDGVVTVEEVPADKESLSYGVVTSEEPKEEPPSVITSEVPKEEPPSSGEQSPFLEFLAQYDIKLDSLDSEDTYSILIYGSGSLVALWLASAIVGAIDSIPLVPKVLELVGLGFSVWFTYRYLIFKENRKELLAKIDELKKEVIGDD